MTIEIKAPAFPESVADGVVAAWHKKPGESVARDELLVEIETDKVVMEVVAPAPGVIDAILVSEGETITSEALLATLVEGIVDDGRSQSEGADEAEPAASSITTSSDDVPTGGVVPMGPAVRALLDEHGLDAQQMISSRKRFKPSARAAEI
jgi:2-oxoglutarate dehydrogenase E2 component (dihydrolipoamide succinyltransferase)